MVENEGKQANEKLNLPKAEFNFLLPSFKTGENKASKQTKSESTVNTCWKDKADNEMKDFDESSESVSSNTIKKPKQGKKLKSKSKNESNLFLIRRACFRGFSEYFKNKFSTSNYSWQRKRGNKKKKTPILTLLREFAEEEFGSLVTNFSEDQWVKFRDSLLTVMFSHRYKKNDDFLKHIDFSKIRSVLYHYTTEARNEFMKNPQFCFLIHHFYIRDHKNFIQSKIDENTMLNVSQLKTELMIMDEEAMMKLERFNPFF